jgi:VWFA-related protein
MKPIRVLIRLLLVTMSLQLVLPARTQESAGIADDQIIRINVELVQVDVQVQQKKTGRPVGSLKKEDFELLEDGVPQRIAGLSQDQIPISVVLLFDLSDSVRPVLKPLAAGALAALEHLKTEDEVAVMVYTGSASLLDNFSTNRQQTVAAIERASTMTDNMKGNQPSYFNEAVFQASAKLAQVSDPNRRKSIIWLTDNVPNVPSGAVHTEQDAFHEVFHTGTVVSALLERSAFSDVALVAYTKNPLFASSRKHDPPGSVYQFAEGTGGEVMKSNKEEVSTKLAQLIDQIRTRYTLSYHPSVKQPKGKFCEIKVQVKAETQKSEGSLVVRAKKGYYR